MKKLIFLAAFITLFSCKENSVSGEEKVSEKKTTMEVSPDNSAQPLRELKDIEDIKKEHSYITSKIKSKSMDSTSFKYNCNDEKKGEVIYFHNQGQLRMIRHTYNEYSHFSATDEYFIKDGDPFFVFYNHVTWNFTQNDQIKDDIAEKRFYLIKNQPIKCLQKEFTILSDDENAPTSNTVAYDEIECPSLDPVLEDFELLFSLRNQKNNLDCLED